MCGGAAERQSGGGATVPGGPLQDGEPGNISSSSSKNTKEFSLIKYGIGRTEPWSWIVMDRHGSPCGGLYRRALAVLAE